MKYVSVITDHTYLLWQQEIQMFNFKKLGIHNQLATVILCDADPSEHARKLARLGPVYFYKNENPNRRYIPTNQIYGLQKYLAEHPQHGDELFLLDQDVIFREVPDFSLMSGDAWYCSDTVGYIGYSYIKQHVDVAEMAAIVGVSVEKLIEKDKDSGGAQWLMRGVDSSFFQKVSDDSLKLYDWMCTQRDQKGSKIQVWTASMWALLWNALLKVPDVIVHKELEFSWPNWSIRDWEKCKIFHNAGVTGKGQGLFYKGGYPGQVPWEVDDFHEVDDQHLSRKYAELMLEYKNSALPS